MVILPNNSHCLNVFAHFDAKEMFWSLLAHDNIYTNQTCTTVLAFRNS